MNQNRDRIRPNRTRDDHWDAYWIDENITQLTLKELVEPIVRKHVALVVSQCRQNLSMAAQVLGISRQTLGQYCKTFGIDLGDIGIRMNRWNGGGRE